MNQNLSFDVLRWLDEHGIAYIRGPGRNVSYGWIEINCPFSGCGDPSAHLGISMNNMAFNCWRCGTKGNIVKLIQAISDCNYKEAQNQILEYQVHYSEPYIEQSKKVPDGVSLDGLNNNVSAPYRKYLRDRSFDDNYLVHKYGLMSPETPFGFWKFRLVAPIWSGARIVNLTGRDITEMATSKYKHLPNNLALIPAKELFYNTNNAHYNKLIVVEGPADVWRIGDGCIASLGMEISRHQLLLLRDLCYKNKIKSVGIMFDAEPLAQEKAYKFGLQLSAFTHSELIQLQKGDPGSLTERSARKLRREYFNDS